MPSITARKDEGLQQISLCIPFEAYQKVLENGWNHREVYLLGLLAKDQNPQQIRRISDLEEGNDKLATKLQIMARKLWDLELRYVPANGEDAKNNKKLTEYAKPLK